jgi:hypothetical protein
VCNGNLARKDPRVSQESGPGDVVIGQNTVDADVAGPALDGAILEFVGRREFYTDGG